MDLELRTVWEEYLTCSLESILIWILASSVVAIFAIPLYRLTLHPLASIPGPKQGAISNIWYAYHVKKGLSYQLGEVLHQKYGKVVRVGPNEVWLNTREAFKAVYSAGNGFEKSDFYLSTSLSKPRLDWLFQVCPQDNLDLLSERDMRRYRLQRRLVGPIYRPENVAKHEEKIESVLVKAITRLRQLGGEDVDLKEWMHIIALECLGAVVLSWSPGMLQHGTDWGSSAHSYQSWRRKSVLGLFPFVTKLEILHKAFGRAFSLIWGITFATPVGFKPFFVDAGRRIKKRIKGAKRATANLNQCDLAADLIKLHQDKPEFTEQYLRKMIMTNFGAGHETLASTLTSLVAMIGANIDVQSKLTTEIRDSVDGVLYSKSQQLVYTQAVIKESKRLNPVIAMSLPRKVPASGLIIHGIWLPAGTIIGCNPLALHCNEDICGGNPTLFNPERWFGNHIQAKEMEVYNLSWGGGARTCPGRHLAEIIVWKVVTKIFKEFDVQVAIPDNPKMPSYFLSMMSGIKVRFLPKQSTIEVQTLYEAL